MKYWRFTFASILLFLMTPAFADETKAGWMLQFHQDTFDKTIMPMSIISEETDGFDKASMFVACDASGTLAALFQNSGISFDNTISVDFRAKAGVRTFIFSSGNIPHFGNAKRLSPSDTEALLTIFREADNENVSFRIGDKKGEFPSIGAEDVIGTMRTNCPK